MNPPDPRILTGLRSVLAIVLGAVAVMIVNLPAPLLVERLLPGSLAPDGMPLTPAAMGAFLPIIFIAGMAGAFVVVFLAPRAPVEHALVFGALALLGDLAVVISLADTAPLWFSAAVVLTVPPQIWLGALLGLAARRRWAARAKLATDRLPAIRTLPGDP